MQKWNIVHWKSMFDVYENGRQLQDFRYASRGKDATLPLHMMIKYNYLGVKLVTSSVHYPFQTLNTV